jgi:hypothetical protein
MESTTRNQSNPIIEQSIGREPFKENFRTYLLNPLSNGLTGFAAFFTLILLTKTFGYLLGSYEIFDLGLQDVIYALTGFVLGAGVKFFEFFGKSE